MKKLFLIIGAPGSGKTTDAELIAKNNDNITHYSTGDMLRAEVASASTLGLEIETYISKGLIVPIKIAIETITNAIKNAPTDIIILDGYPRSMEQLTALDEYLQTDSSLELTSAIEIKVSEETAKDRVLGRARGADDNTEVFNNRMKVYTEPLNDIQDFYKKKNILKVISGEGTIEEIVKELESFVKSKIGVIMSMVYCRGCAKEIHETAVSCPHCGATQGIKKERNTVGLIFITIGWSVVFWFVALFISGFIIGALNPAQAEELGGEFGESAALPYLIISFLVAGVLAKLGKLPGTSKKL